MTEEVFDISSPETGLVLIEVLISLAVLALMAGSVTFLLFQLGAVQVQTIQAHDMDSTARLRSVIRSSVSAALNETESFRVSGGSYELAMKAETQLGPLAFDEYDIVLKPAGRRQGGARLYLLSMSLVSDDGGVAFERVLPPELSIQRIQYYGVKDENGLTPEWHEEWSAQFPPGLIKIDFGLGDEDELSETMIIGSQ